MTVPIFHGYDEYAVGQTEIAQDGWVTHATSSGVDTTSPRTGTRRYMHDGTNSGKRINPPTPRQEFYVGFGFWIDTAGSGGDSIIFAAHNAANATDHFWLRLNGSRQLSLHRGHGAEGINSCDASAPTATFWQDTVVQPLATWIYLELYGFVDDTAGILTIKQNEVTLFSGTSLDTKNGSANTIDWLRWTVGGTTAPNWAQDDTYIVDPTTGPNNTFLGDCRVYTDFPNADSTPLTMTPVGSGTHALNVDEVPNDGDTTRNTATASGNKDMYTFPASVSNLGAIRAISVKSRSRKDDAGGCTVRNVFESAGGGGGATTLNGAAYNPGTSYGWKEDIAETDPDTGSAWTKASRDALKAGFERTA